MTYSLFLENTDNGMMKWTHFFPMYERHLSKYVNDSVRVLEIGVLGGGSVQYWKKWLGPRAHILGIDIDETCRDYVEPQISIEIGDQSDPAFLEKIEEQYGPFDIVIDDGSHTQTHVRTTFDCLYPRLTDRGVYIVEDIEHSYYPWQAGGLRASTGFVEHAKTICDLVNGQAWRENRNELENLDLYTRNTMSVSFYASMIVFERGFYATPNLHWQRTGHGDTEYYSNLDYPEDAG